MSKLEIVSMIKINGVWYLQEEVPPEELKRLLEIKITNTMENIGFKRIKTA